MKIATAGTMESNDCLMTVSQNKGIKITVKSVVYQQFGKQIEQVIHDTLKQYDITNIHVDCQDKGALDYTIKARLMTALQRLGEIDA
jgi:citrate lyase subunit gamma (acyl carrier protein)